MAVIRARIISGTSFFTGSAVIGIALGDTCDSVAFTKLADEIGKSGRPASVEMARNDASATAEMLRGKWLAWAEREGIALAIDPGVTPVATPF